MRLRSTHPAGAPAAFLALAIALAGCSSTEDASGPASSTASPPPAELPVAGEPVRLVSATLEDTVVRQEDGRISWTTTWVACFAPADDDPAGVARWEAVVDRIERRLSWIAPVIVVPGELELEALAEGAGRVLLGLETPREWTPPHAEAPA